MVGKVGIQDRHEANLLFGPTLAKRAATERFVVNHAAASSNNKSSFGLRVS
jgi:hypothetical protein